MNKILLKYKFYFFLSIILAIASSMFLVIESLFIKNLIDSITSGDFNIIKNNIKIYLLYIILAAILTFIYRQVRYKYTQKSLIFLKDEILKKIIYSDIQTFKSENSAKKISLLSNDIKIIEDDLFNNLFVLIVNFVSLATALICLFMLSIEIAISTLLIISLVAIIPKLFSKKLIFLKTNYSELLQYFTIKIKDIFSGIEVIKSFNIEKNVIDDYSKINKEVEISKYKFSILNTKAQFISQILLSLIFATLFSVGVYLIFNNKITYGILIAAFQLIGSVSGPIYMNIEYINKLKSLKNISKKISDLFKTETKKIKGIEKVIEKKTFENVINIRNLSFRYDEGENVLNEINISIEKGKKYAIVGGSGSGKSTLIKAISKEIENYSGDIFIDNINLKEITFEDLYSIIAIIHQNVFLFDTTIKENIVLYQKYSSDMVDRAIRDSGLIETVDSKKNNLNTMVGENGNNLSGGEKQRIAIARALIKNVPILILDEATSSLDNTISTQIENQILSMKDTTAIVITHKLKKELLEKYDEILVMKNGYIVERGTFETLINYKSNFFSLYNTLA